MLHFVVGKVERTIVPVVWMQPQDAVAANLCIVIRIRIVEIWIILAVLIIYASTVQVVAVAAVAVVHPDIRVLVPVRITVRVINRVPVILRVDIRTPQKHPRFTIQTVVRIIHRVIHHVHLLRTARPAVVRNPVRMIVPVGFQMPHLLPIMDRVRTRTHVPVIIPVAAVNRRVHRVRGVLRGLVPARAVAAVVHVH